MIPNSVKPLWSGVEKSGKTAFICALLQLAEKKGLKGAGFKPFDKGLLKRNARDELHDGERICRYMVGEPSETLVAPYYANEDYPIEMSFRRDGIRLNWTVIEQRIAVLEELYDKTFVETPSSLLAPLTESMMVCDWMKTLKAELIWLIDPVQAHFLPNLSEINLAKEHGIPFTVVFNNRSRIQDQDLLF